MDNNIFGSANFGRIGNIIKLNVRCEYYQIQTKITDLPYTKELIALHSQCDNLCVTNTLIEGSVEKLVCVDDSVRKLLVTQCWQLQSAIVVAI